MLTCICSTTWNYSFEAVAFDIHLNEIEIQMSTTYRVLPAPLGCRQIIVLLWLLNERCGKRKRERKKKKINAQRNSIYSFFSEYMSLSSDMPITHNQCEIYRKLVQLKMLIAFYIGSFEKKNRKEKKKSMEIFGLKLNMSIKGFWALGDRINYSRNWLMLIGSKSHMNDMQRWKVWEQFAKGKGHSK